MSNLRGTDVRDEAAANLARNLEAGGYRVWKTEIAKGILRVIREVQETETRAFESAQAALKRDGKRQPEALLQAHIREVIRESLTKTFFPLNERSVNEGVRKGI
jgi:hypothetical protein